MEEVIIIGIDLAKRSFQLHGARADGSVAFRKKLRREKVLAGRSSTRDAPGQESDWYFTSIASHRRIAATTERRVLALTPHTGVGAAS